MSALTAIHETDGLDRYLEEIEARLLEAVRRHPGLAAGVGAEALAAGGKRLRPLLVFLAAPAGREPPYTAGVAVELVHMATLVHDDLIDRAGYRRGRESGWAMPAAPSGPRVRARATASAARAARSTPGKSPAPACVRGHRRCRSCSRPARTRSCGRRLRAAPWKARWCGSPGPARSIARGR